MLTLTDTVRVLPGVGPKIAQQLGEMGVSSIEDLLRWFPRRYLDASNPVSLRNLIIDQEAVVHVSVIRTEKKHARASYVDLYVEDGTGEAIIRFFGQPYRALLNPGTNLLVYGTPVWVGRKRGFVNPMLLDSPKVVPIYPQSADVRSHQISRFVQAALQAPLEGMGTVPAEVTQEQGLADLSWSVRTLHQPERMADLEPATQRMRFEEVWQFFLGLRQEKHEQVSGVHVSLPDTWWQQAVENLPFTLTDEQQAVLAECRSDLGSGSAMLRLVNGDVGTGKTVLAALLAAAVAQKGMRTLILVPTSVLVAQHEVTLTKLLTPFRVSVGRWTASQKDVGPQVLVGTHALLSEGTQFSDVGLVVVDEQHRFGVKQRAKLRAHGEQVPHYLSLSATPIPRTLALTLFRGLHVSFLRERPQNRPPVHTEIIPPKRLPEVHKAVLAARARGEQVYVVCPQVGDGEEVAGVHTVTVEFERLRTSHPEYGRFGLLHGQLKPAEKEAVLMAFAAGDIDVLVATTVVEVGVDVPNATVLVVRSAERFGLAQLHQLRGRVGRGGKPGMCFLTVSNDASSNVQILAETEDGFAVAEADLMKRGPGELTGSLQAGLPKFRFTALQELEFLTQVRDLVERYVG